MAQDAIQQAAAAAQQAAAAAQQAAAAAQQAAAAAAQQAATAAAQQAAAAIAGVAAAAQQAATAAAQQAAGAAAPVPGPGAVQGSLHVIEALGFLKDWVTALVGIQTFAIGAVAVALQASAQTGTQAVPLTGLQSVLIAVTVVAFAVSIFSGGQLLYMLPGSAQRVPNPNEDVFSLSTSGPLTIRHWARMHWAGFATGVILFVIFLGARVFRI